MKQVPLFLAPMAGYTDLPFRLLAQNYGADVTVSEMISAKGLYYKDKKTKKLLMTDDNEKNYGIQIFGSEPDILKSAVKLIEEASKDGDFSYSFIDFNAGCPAPKIVKNGDGSALIKNLDLLKENVESIKEASSKPVSVKTRIGFDENENNIVNIAKTIEEAGADFLTIHGRTRSQFYSGKSNWEAIAEAVDNVKIPIILSGDIINPETAKEALETGVEGLMIGRAAVDNPFIFNQIKDFLQTGNYKTYSKEEKIQLILEHLKLVEKFNDDKNQIVNLRKHLAAYTKGFENATDLRRKIFQIKDIEEVKKIFVNLSKI